MKAPSDRTWLFRMSALASMAWISVACGAPTGTTVTRPLRTASPPPEVPRETFPLGLVPQLGHRKTPLVLAVSPDSHLLASAGAEARVYIWELGTGMLLRTLDSGSTQVRSLAWAADGRRLVTGDVVGALSVWDAATGARKWTASMPTDVRALAIVNDVVFAAGGPTVARFGLGDGKEQAHASVPRPVLALRPREGGRLVLVDRLRAIASVDAASLSLREEIAPPGDGCARGYQIRTEVDPVVAISDDGRRVLTGCRMYTVQARGTNDGFVVRDLDGKAQDVASPPASLVGNVEGATFSHDGAHVLMGSTSLSLGSTFVVDLASGAMRRLGGDDATFAVAVTGDGRAIGGGGDKKLRVIDWKSGSIAAVLAGATGPVTAIGAHHRTNRLLAAQVDATARFAYGSITSTWDLETLSLSGRMPKGQYPTKGLALTPDDERMASLDAHSEGSEMNELAFFHPRTGKELRVGQTIAARAIAFSADGRRLYTASSGSRVTDVTFDPDTHGPEYHYASVRSLLAHDPKSGAVLHEFGKLAVDIRAVAASPIGDVVAAALPTGVVLFEGATGKRLAQLADTKDAVACAFSSKGESLAVGDTSGNVRVFATATRARLAETKVEGTVTALAFAGDVVFAGTRTGCVSLFDIASKAIRSFDKHVGPVTGIALLASGKHFATSSEDGTIRVARLDDLQSVTLTSSGDEWLAYADDGTFDASRNGASLVAVTEGLHAYRIDQLAVRFNRPDLLLERLGLGSRELLDHLKARHDARVKRLGVDPAKLTGDFAELPQATLTRVTVTGNEASIGFDFETHGRDAARYEVHVDGVPAFGSVGKPLTGRRGHVDERVRLSQGVNRIEVTVHDVGGAESLRALASAEGPTRGSRDLWFVGFGVSKYANAKYDLSYPDKDVRDMADALSAAQGAKSYASVHARVFTNSEVRIPSLAVAHEMLRGAKVDDTVIVMVAGHGVHANDREAKYYFVTHDADLRALDRTAIPFEGIEDLLRDTPARNRLLLMDTCESGEQEEDDALAARPGRGQRARTTRGLVLDLRPPAATALPKRPFLLSRERFIYNDVLRLSGAIVLSSSRRSELSYEYDELRNGAFTKGLLLALATKEADSNNDGDVSTDELRAFVPHFVAQRTEDLQHPTVDRDNIHAKFALPVVPSAAFILTRDGAKAR